MMHRMPATNPRLTITIQPSTQAHLRRLSELTGNSQSALIAQLLEGSAPVFERMIRLLEAAEAAKESMRGKLAADMEAAQAKVEQQLGLQLDGMDAMSSGLLDQAEAIKRRSGRASASTRSGGSGVRSGGSSTPFSNRGVRSTPAKAKKSTRTRG